jgi:hypothetical protein
MKEEEEGRKRRCVIFGANFREMKEGRNLNFKF